MPNQLITKESVGGLLLIVITGLALLISNSPLYSLYQQLLAVKFLLNVNQWINEGLMTLFFFVIGLELKRECITGHLRELHNVLLPVCAAVGGVIFPIIIYSLINNHHPEFHKGWAIPMATDIAFALGIMSLYSRYITREMKIFLLTLAIIDDLMAIIVIAIFHTESLSAHALLFAGLAICVLFLFNLLKIKRLAPYLIIGVILWVTVLKSGIHATLSGVILAMFIPLKGKNDKPLLRQLEDKLHPIVTFIVLPIFALANAGIRFDNFPLHDLLHPVTLGIMFGLLLGKPLGVISFTFITQKMLRLPQTISWLNILLIGCFAGIGFTMSLFIASLTFGSSAYLMDLCRAGILLGSILSIALASLFVLFNVVRKPKF